MDAWASAEVFVGGANFFKLLELDTMTNEGLQAPAKGPELEIFSNSLF